VFPVRQTRRIGSFIVCLSSAQTVLPQQLSIEGRVMCGVAVLWVGAKKTIFDILGTLLTRDIGEDLGTILSALLTRDLGTLLTQTRFRASCHKQRWQ
jgi:hypothetical protein